ncbi:MAG: molybdopterin converting factor subunit 1 [Gammaproteobacteria bacterium]|nr:molybdopterin converting factor subunit 1 [Gammaproteobacteria bacterium]MBU1654941.1 molybdopterin converting factor subunit 1 [Gammaproteobacteria bacterium]MBU1960493.1 molybdopterin converting factor subunit 1 [Gammaproteobacteria bacterium]
MIRVLYFASLKDRVGTGSEEMEVAEGASIATVMEELKGRGGVWADAFGGKTRVLAAINQEMSRPEETVRNGDEVAFFPPVTGG